MSQSDPTLREVGYSAREGWVCPLCHGGLVERENGSVVICRKCNEHYPMVDNVPYLAYYGTHWRTKLRELLTFHDYWHKIHAGRLERDRFGTKVGEARQTFSNIAEQFRRSISPIDLKATPRILDVGAGCGEVSQALAEGGAEVWAVDLNYLDLHRNPRWMTLRDAPEPFDYYTVWRGQPFKPAFRRAIADGDHLPLADGFFDIVLLRAVAHHVIDLEWFFREANRVLKPRGTIMLIGEPIASVVDRTEEYLADDTDWQEGMTEGRPPYRAYSAALRSAGFGRLEARTFSASLGFRFGRFLARRGKSALLPWMENRRFRGLFAELLSFVGAGVNITATKRRETRPDARQAGKAADAPNISLAELLLQLPDHVESGRALLREHLEADIAVGRIDFANDIPRFTARGFREIESVEGRPARYLLSEFQGTLDGGLGERALHIVWNGSRLEGSDVKVKISVNGTEMPVREPSGGWSMERIAVPRELGEVLDVRISQPGLTTRELPPGSDSRDVGVALALIEVV